MYMLNKFKKKRKKKDGVEKEFHVCIPVGI